MAEQPFPSDPSIADRVRATLAHAAADVGVDSNPAAAVSHRVQRRRRRRRGLQGGLAVAALVASVGVVMAMTGGDSFVATDDVPDTSAPPDDTEVDEPMPAPTPEPAPVTVDDVTTEVGVGFAADRLLPWGDGFLAITYEYVPVAFPELDDDIVALFPDDIVTFFEARGGFPPTVDEAQALLADAGLLDTVLAVLDEHPEVADLFTVYDNPPALIAAVTDDGAAWTEVVLEPPAAVGTWTVSGDRLVGWGNTGAFDGGASVLSIVTTTDLSTWTMSESTLEATTEPEYPLRGDVWVSSVAVLGERWIASAEQSWWVDEYALLPADVQDRVDELENGYGTSFGADGIEIEFHDGTESVSLEYSWDELGLDGNPLDDQQTQTLLLAGDLTSPGSTIPLPSVGDWARPSVIGGQFALVSDGVLVSDDLITWQPLDGIPERFVLTSTASTPAGDVLLDLGWSEQRAFLVAPDGSVSELVLPELPEQMSPISDIDGGAAWIVTVDEVFESDDDPFTFEVDHDGYTFSVTSAFTRDSALTEWVLRDTATGEVVRAGSFDQFDDQGLPDILEQDEATGAIDVVIRDEAGDEIVRIPDEAVEAAAQAASDPDSGGDSATDSEWRPDHWLIATDGSDWLVLDLDDPDPTSSDSHTWPVAAINDDRVLYRSNAEWHLAIIGT